MISLMLALGFVTGGNCLYTSQLDAIFAEGPEIPRAWAYPKEHIGFEPYWKPVEFDTSTVVWCA